MYSVPSPERTVRRTPDSSPQAVDSPTHPRAGLRQWLRTPLFWKLLAPQLLGSATVVLWVMAPGTGRPSLAVLAAILLLFVALAVGTVRLALVPLRSLSETARRVTDGEEDARAPSSPFSDHDTAHLIDTFNQMLDTLATLRMQRRADAGWMLEATEDERERIARDLFGRPAQTLAAALVRLRLLRVTCSDAESRRAADEVAVEVRQALDEVRGLARRLHPPELGELGTRAALEAVARHVEEHGGGVVRIHGSIPDDRMSAGVRSALFRIVEELVNEAVERAVPPPIDLSFTISSSHIVAEISHAGSGSESASDRRRELRHRADFAGGRLVDVHGADGTETHHLTLPLIATQPGAGSGEPIDGWIPAVASGVPR